MFCSETPAGSESSTQIVSPAGMTGGPAARICSKVGRFTVAIRVPAGCVATIVAGCRAGSARVVVPVRPGFEVAVTHFLETGKLWGGEGEPPQINTPLYVSIIDEIRERTGAPQGEKAVGDPWDVRVPTALGGHGPRITATAALEARRLRPDLVTTAAFELAAPASGATISPTSAFFFRTVPSKGAMIRVLSTATSASFSANLATSMEATTRL